MRVLKSHPCGIAAATLLTASSAQERAIAASDQPEAILHEIDRYVAKGGGLPRRIGDTGGPEDRFGDFAVARAFRMSIHRLKHPPKPATLLLGQSPVDRHLSSVDGTPKTGDRVDAVEAIGPQRDQCDNWVPGRGISCEEESNGVRAATLDNA